MPEDQTWDRAHVTKAFLAMIGILTPSPQFTKCSSFLYAKGEKNKTLFFHPLQLPVSSLFTLIYCQMKQSTPAVFMHSLLHSFSSLAYGFCSLISTKQLSFVTRNSSNSPHSSFPCSTVTHHITDTPHRPLCSALSLLALSPMILQIPPITRGPRVPGLFYRN